MLGPDIRPARRGFSWRLGSSMVMGLTGAIARSFLYGLNKVETVGLEPFLKLLDERRAGHSKQGLLTASNHVSVLDDPVMWGVLPLKYAFDPVNLRWGLGAHDICFKNKFTSKFFTLGQVFPTHRLLHSPHGGLFQPTLAEAVHVLSQDEPSPPSRSPGLTFTTNAGETFPSPSAHDSSRGAWVHVFPEACVHQHPELALRYFKWGVSRMILESNPAPLFVPMFIDGFQNIMHETRKKPRWLPRVGHKVRVFFGKPLDTADVFGEQRDRWRQLVKEQTEISSGSTGPSFGDGLKYGPRAVQLRIKVAAAVRSHIARLRKEAGCPDDDPTFELAETWKRDPALKKFQSPVDGSIIHRE